MYDWANSAFQTTIIAAVFPDLFQRVAAAGLPPADATCALCLGHDHRGHDRRRHRRRCSARSPITARIKKRLLAVFVGDRRRRDAAMVLDRATATGCSRCALHDRQHRRRASIVFYDSLLPHIAAPDELDRVSTAGLRHRLSRRRHAARDQPAVDPVARRSFGLPDAGVAIKLSLRQRRRSGGWSSRSRSSDACRSRRGRCEPDRASRIGRSIARRSARLVETFQELRGYRQAFLLLLAFLLYNDGIQTIIRMASIYGAEIGLDRNAQIAAFAPGAVRRRAVRVPVRRAGRAHRRQDRRSSSAWRSTRRSACSATS